VGSHYHFFGANRALGIRLDIPAKTAVRFEPGAEQEVALVTFGGTRRVIGFSGLVGGSAAAEATARRLLAAAHRLGFKDARQSHG